VDPELDDKLGAEDEFWLLIGAKGQQNNTKVRLLITI